MNTDLNNEEYPRLVPPDVVYENKASLKKPVVIPLYAKILSAAAAVALLFGIFWNRSVMPKQDLMAELKPMKAVGIVTDETVVLAESQAHFVMPRNPRQDTPRKVVKPSTAQKEEPVVLEKVEMPLLASLQPKAAPMLMDVEYRPSELLANDVFYANNDALLQPEENYDGDISLVGRGILRWTGGEHDSFAGILSEGLRSVKNEMASIATTIQSSRAQLRQRVH